MDMNSLWKETCALLQQSMLEISYNTWIKYNLSPVRLEKDILSLRVAMPNMAVLVETKYRVQIENMLQRVAGHPISANFVTGDLPEESEPDNTESMMNPRYTFDNFVVGSGNRFAHAACLAVAEAPAEAYNPLFIYGGVGLGKTHLMHAIGNYIHEQAPEKKLMYITSERFTNEMIDAIQQKKMPEFRSRYRQADVLMVDDIQFIAGRESTQMEFFNTFNDLHSAGKQIVLTSDKPPKEIARLEERLCSRFEWGLIADIQRPDIDTRIAILREKARQSNIRIPDDVMELIADNVDSNIRELEGCLSRLVAYTRMAGLPVNVQTCREALREQFEKKQHKPPTAELIMHTVCDYYSLEMEDMLGGSRRREVALPRQIAMYLTREMTGMSLPQIGQVFGGRDHTTVLHSCSTIKSAAVESESMVRILDDIRALIREA